MGQTPVWVVKQDKQLVEFSNLSAMFDAWDEGFGTRIDSKDLLWVDVSEILGRLRSDGHAYVELYNEECLYIFLKPAEAF